MLKELIKEVTMLQDKERFLDKLLPQCISLISTYSENNKLKTKIYIDRIDDLIHEYNLCFVNEEGSNMWETLYQLRRKDQNGRYETIWAKAPCKGWKTIQKIRVCQPSPLQPAICTL